MSAPTRLPDGVGGTSRHSKRAVSPSDDAYAYPPRGLDHAAAARYLGISPAALNDLVKHRKVPLPRQVGPSLVWDRLELDAAFALFPRVGGAEARKVLPSTEHEGHPNVYTPDTLAARWGCSGNHVRNMVKRGDIAGFKFGGKLLRISVADVIAFEARGY